MEPLLSVIYSTFINNEYANVLHILKQQWVKTTLNETDTDSP